MNINEGQDELITADETRLRSELIKLRRQRDSSNNQNAHLLETVDELQRTIDLLELVRDSECVPPQWLLPKSSGRKKHATLALLLSDTHFDEVVHPEEVGFLNKYDRRIAEMRLRAWTENSVKLARHYLSGVTYDGVVLMLGGDTFSGDIHEELAQTNADTILGSVLHWTEQLSASINVLAGEFGKVHVAAVPGNHGRLSRKPRMKLRSKTNMDWLLAKMLERTFVADKRVTFQVGENADALISIYGKGHLLTHGDQVNGGGGIGGIWPPIMRMRARKAQRAMEINEPFQTLWMGHWHQLIQTPGIIVNGSLKGTDEYAWINNFGHEVPQQALAVVTPEHGVTMQAPVFCMDRKKEKW